MNNKTNKIILNKLLNKTTVMSVLVLIFTFSVLMFSVSAATMSETTAGLKIISLKYEPYPVQPGQYFKIWIKIENSGVDTAKDMVFELSPEYPFSIDSNEKALRDIGELKVGDEVVLEYKIKVDRDAVEGSNDLNYKYTISKAAGPWVSGALKVAVQTNDAILALKNLETTPSSIGPGETAHIKLTLENLADSPLKDIRVNLELYKMLATATSVSFVELPFTPFGSSNVKTLNVIEGTSEKIVEFDLIADVDAKAKVYKLPITVTYSDYAGTNYSKSYITALLVSSEPDLSIGIESTTLTKEQKSGNVVIKFVNKGTTDIKFMNVKLKPSSDYDLISSDEVYVGSVDSDDYQTAEFKLNLKKTPDQIELPITIEFKDGVNKAYNQDVNVKLNLFTNGQLGKPTDGLFGKVILIVIIAAVGYFVYRKFKKKKK
jgi:hypothetical protein